MYVQKNFGLRGIVKFSGYHVLWITVWVSFVVFIYEYFGTQWLKIPWLPLSIIGTAVAFYIGFKNNQAYDRLWEARKIWGGIVNDSRSWGSAVISLVSSQFSNEEIPEEELHQIKTSLIYRHIAWLYTLRSQLLIPTSWEHLSQGGMVGRYAKLRQKSFGVGLYDDEHTHENLAKFLKNDDFDKLINQQNTATQIINKQFQELTALRKRNIIEDFRHMSLQKNLQLFYDHQGKSERIKKFPLPRQYGSMSSIFVGIFIFLLPFGMVSEFSKLGEYGTWIAIPFTVLVSWVYLVMELVGDYSENPFEGLGNDIPMLSLCRTIEIDLLEMLGEKELPLPITPKNNVLL